MKELNTTTIKEKSLDRIKLKARLTCRYDQATRIIRITNDFGKAWHIKSPTLSTMESIYFNPSQLN